jgi:hypothetical protein
MKRIIFILMIFTITFLNGEKMPLRVPAMPFLGLQEDFDRSNDLASLQHSDYAELGIKISRTGGGPFVWNIIEPEKGKFDFRKTDAALLEATKAGMTLLATLWPYAEWDQKKKRKPVKIIHQIENDPLPPFRDRPVNQKDFEAFLEVLFERYDGDSDFGKHPVSNEVRNAILKNPIIYWEICNEVDRNSNTGPDDEFQVVFSGSLDDYSAILSVVNKSAKKVSSSIKIVCAAPLENTQNYYNTLFRLGADRYFDIYNIHDEESVMEARKLYSMYSGREKPIWITEQRGETFFSEKIGSENEFLREKKDKQKKIKNISKKDKPEFTAEMEAVNAVKIFTRVAAYKFITTLFGYSIPPKDKFNKAGKKIDKSKFYSYFVDQSGRKTPLYYTNKVFAEKIEGFSTVDTVLEKNGKYFYRFNFTGKDPIFVLFIHNSTDKSYKIPLEKARYKITDAFGNEKTAEIDALEVSDNMLYYLQKSE